jgi:phosphatidylethanolamine-binding protein (PEBP) family uncharacterized protein
MRRPLEAISSAASISSAVLLLAIALAGCGSSSSPGSSSSVPSTPRPGSSAVAAKAPTVIPLTSTAIAGAKIPARYTCDGANTAPPLKWGAVPSATKEIVLFALGVTPGQASIGSSSIEWALGGVKAEVHELAAGKLPTGAFLEEASDGKRHYSICPPRGQTKHYEFVVYAVPALVQVTREVNGVKLLHNLAEGPPNFRATAKGELSATYTRG